MTVTNSPIKKDDDQINKDIDKFFQMWKQYFLKHSTPVIDEAGRKTDETEVSYCAHGVMRPINEKTWNVTAEGVSNSSHQVLYADVEWKPSDGSDGSITPTTGDFITGYDLTLGEEIEYTIEEIGETCGDAYTKILLRRNLIK